MWLAFSLISAIFFGIRGILYHWTSQRPMNRNLMLMGSFMSGAVISLLLSLFMKQSWTTGTLVGIFMGIFSFTANSSLYKGFAVGKASLIAILMGLPPVVVVIFTFFLWNETLSQWQLFAFVIILIGITMIRYSNDISLKRLQGAQWGLLAVLFFALNDTSSKYSIRLGADIFPTLFVMFMTGSLLFFVFWLTDRTRASGLKEKAKGETAGEAARELSEAQRETADRLVWSGGENIPLGNGCGHFQCIRNDADDAGLQNQRGHRSGFGRRFVERAVHPAVYAYCHKGKIHAAGIVGHRFLDSRNLDS
ncbi:DMT family transporter [Paenibacillaceae bacterium T2]|uniref:DMT family transporter n=1 Tax=Ferviditalea candida TaxID=3108399 RepID=A0ABU5ZGU5_9BACL|nr:DMT family transporter [Paenibacillaceae bacterium T2]